MIIDGVNSTFYTISNQTKSSYFC